MPTFGREQIFTSVPEINDGNILDVLANALPVFVENQHAIKHLYDVYKGNQKILGRVKEVRPEINNKVVINRANEIVSFKVSYLLSEPIMYIGRGDADNSTQINALNNYMHLESKPAQDKQIADDFSICGVAYRMVLPNRAYSKDSRDESPFKIYTLDPYSAFVIKSTALGNRVMAGVYLIKTVDGQGVEHNTACVYTANRYYEIDYEAVGFVSGAIKKNIPHALGRVPIFEYINNESRLGAFEVVETLLDAMNTLESNRLDGTEQTVQSLMVFKNCDVDTNELNAIREMGAVKIKSGNGVDSSLSLISPDLKQTDQQVLMDNLYRTVLGYALDTATLQQIAYANGINMSVNSMTQAQKAELRLAAIMSQSKMPYEAYNTKRQ